MSFGYRCQTSELPRPCWLKFPSAQGIRALTLRSLNTIIYTVIICIVPWNKNACYTFAYVCVYIYIYTYHIHTFYHSILCITLYRNTCSYTCMCTYFLIYSTYKFKGQSLADFLSSLLESVTELVIIINITGIASVIMNYEHYLEVRPASVPTS